MNPDPRTERAVDSASDAQIGRLLTDVANAPDTVVDVDATANFIIKKAFQHPGVRNASVKRERWNFDGSERKPTWSVFVLDGASPSQICGSGCDQENLDTALSMALADFDAGLREQTVRERVKREMAQIEAAMKAVDAEKSQEYINDAKVAGLSPVPHADGVYASEVEGAMEDDEKPARDDDPYHADNDPNWGENNPANSNFIGRK